MMVQRIFTLNINERAFLSIRCGTKKVEVRANKIGSVFGEMKIGDLIEFVSIISGESHFSTIRRVSHYKDVRTLLVNEGTEKTLSSGKDIEEGIKSIESIGNYKKIIRERGVFAIVLD